MTAPRELVDLAAYKAKHGSSVEFLMGRLKTTRYKVYGLLDPENKPLVLDDELVASLADLLESTPRVVRQYYAALIRRRCQAIADRRCRSMVERNGVAEV